MIEGNIGAGKTSLVNLLSQELNARVLMETFENNPFLPDFYKDPGKNAFPLEMFFLAERYRQLTAFNPLQHDMFGQPVVSDYFIAKSAIFAGFNLSGTEWDLFIRFFEIVEKTMPLPDLMIYLHRPIAYLQHNIRKRGRGYEELIQNDYLERVNDGYQRFLKNEKRFPVVVLDCSDLDFFETGQTKRLMDKVLNTNWGKSLHYLDFKPGG